MDAFLNAFWTGFGGTLGVVSALVVAFFTMSMITPKPKKKTGG